MKKLMRYLRWSNLVRKHFVIPTKGDLSTSDLLEREHVTPTAPGQGSAAGHDQAATPCHGEGYGRGDHAAAGSNGFSLAREGSYKGSSLKYTFSDAGECAAGPTHRGPQSRRIWHVCQGFVFPLIPTTAGRAHAPARTEDPTFCLRVWHAPGTTARD